jgi:endonuclease YncB( thermonuclease family)
MIPSRFDRFLCSHFGRLLAACATTPKVTRIDANETVDLSGNWNDTDSRQVAEEMVKDSLARPWLTEFQSEKNTKPRVIVGLGGEQKQ